MLRKIGAPMETSLALQIKYREVQAHYEQLRQYYLVHVQQQYALVRQRYMLIACAWCQRRLRWQRTAASSGGGETSHGICRPCAARLFTQMSTMAG